MEYMKIVSINNKIGHYIGFDQTTKKHMAIGAWCSPRMNTHRESYFGEIILGDKVEEAAPKEISLDDAVRLAKIIYNQDVVVK